MIRLYERRPRAPSYVSVVWVVEYNEDGTWTTMPLCSLTRAEAKELKAVESKRITDRQYRVKQYMRVED